MMKLGFVLAGGLGTRMCSQLPKVLHEVEGRPMVLRAIDALRQGGATSIVAVLSHRSQEVGERLPLDVAVVVQDRPRGTASAIVAAEHLIPNDDTAIVVGFGDMPWLNPRSVGRLLSAVEAGAHAAVLVFDFEDPPHFGRVIRDERGEFVDIVQHADCSFEQRKMTELDAGLFAFQGRWLRAAVRQLDDLNQAGELYLTDVPGKIAAAGGIVECVPAERIEEALGVNDQAHLKFAQAVPALERAVSILRRWGTATRSA